MSEKLYPCADCGKLRTEAEGGTTFTVCDECWGKAFNSKSRADRCDAHFLGCDCHEYRVQQDREKLAMWERLMPEIRCALTQRILQSGSAVSEQYGLVLGEINAMYGEKK